MYLSENEIEIFERKFLAPLSVSRSVSSTRILITHDPGDSVSHAPAPDSVMSQVRVPAPSVSVVTSPAQHVRVLRTSSKVSADNGAPQVSGQGTVSDQHLSWVSSIEVLANVCFQDSDCDSGAYSRSSSPEPIYERLDRWAITILWQQKNA